MKPEEMPKNENGDAPEIRFALLSHDVRSALGGIVGGLSLIDGQNLSGPDQARLASAQAAAKMLAELIVDLGEAKQMPGDDSVALGPLLAELETRWSSEAGEKGIKVEFRQPAELSNVSCLNRTGLLRVYNNLISNAVNNAGRGLIVVETSENDQKTVQISISDQGPGFSDEALDHLFLFGSRPKDSVGEGSGLGLFIVKMLVDRAGGTVKAYNRPDGGAVVEVALTAASVAPEISETGGLPDLSALNILVAEDNVTNQMVVTQMLAAMNANYSVASDGVQALQMFDLAKFDLCLIDIEMPRKSGLEVMREIRVRDDDRATIPLIALTAYAMDEHRERINRAGADGLIAKPLTDIAGFGRSILGYCGGKSAENPVKTKVSGDEVIQRDIYDGLAKVIGKDSMQELLGKVQEDLQSVDTGIKAGFAENSTAPIRANTHILISVAGAIGAVGLQNTAQEMNAAANDEDWSRIVALEAVCLSGIDDVQGFIDSELKVW